MNNQRSSAEQILIFVTLAIVANMVWQQFFHPAQSVKVVPPRPAPKLAQAFTGIDPAQGPMLTLAAAATEKAALEADIKTNPKDPKAAWDNLRLGLIEQYVLAPRDTQPAVIHYDATTRVDRGDDIEAQAYYQEGDLLWHWARGGTTYLVPGLKSWAGADATQNKSVAVSAFEYLIHRGRGGASAFINYKIYVAALPLAGMPHFNLLKVSDLHGTIANPDPNGILDRLDAYYSPKVLYVAFDTLVKLLGNHPDWSVGVAILIFAFCTRFIMQPLNKKQYESMKGMALIAPEMKKIQEKYKGKPDQQMQQMKEIQALQKAHGANPMMGCMLAVVQLPIFFVVVYPLINYYTPRIQLMGASFLWVRNLAQPDIALLVLYAFSMFVSVRLSSPPATDDMQRQQQQMMSIMMPLMFPFMLKGYPSAFILYWMTFNVLSMFFQYRMMKAADPTKTLIGSLLQGAGTAAPAAPSLLLGGGAGQPAAKPADSVPARPKNGAKAGQVKSISAGSKSAGGKSSGPRGTPQNGSANGAATNGSGAWNQIEDEHGIDAEAIGSDANGQPNGGAPAGSASPDSRKPANTQRARRRRRY